jgi:hypothetical protein
MRKVAVILGLSLCVLAGVSGCTPQHIINDGSRRKDIPDGPPPSAESLVSYMNENAKRINEGQAVQSTRVSINCSQGRQSIGLDGMMVCQYPRNFRLKANLLGQPGADVGSNGEEFWYWISKGDPYVFHCSHADLDQGKVRRLPFPFQPEMVVSALGMARYNPEKKYEVKVGANHKTYELIEEATSPQGNPIQKVTVFNRNQVSAPNPQVVAHVLRDAQGKEICTATIAEVVVNQQTGAILPTKVQLSWPAEKMKMSMQLNDVQVVQVTPEDAARKFSRRNLTMQGFDLAQWKVDGAPTGYSQGGNTSLIRQTGAWGRQ